ncbi:MAG: histidine kinase N-terminal 7TM domain-containing protein [Eubacteriales bacterium]|nr:histidine kinase N-terminal 7TM domain-containing protein [Eubacteriales bacterium]
MSNTGFIATLSIIILILLILIAAFIYRIKNKQQIHYVFLATIVCMFYWTLLRTIQLFSSNAAVIDAIERFHYVGVCLLPVCLLFTGLVFARTSLKFSPYYLLLLIVPAVSITMSLTNEYHHLFIVKRSFISTEFVYGPYYPVHEIYSYLCIAVGLYFLLNFSIRNSGFFSKQSVILQIGFAIPLSVVILSTQKIVVMSVFYENISFSFSILFFAIAIFKFKFLNIVPIALQRIVDLISDSYLVINKDLEIIDFNQTLVDKFQSVMTIRRQDVLTGLAANPHLKSIFDQIVGHIGAVMKTGVTVAFEEHIIDDNFDKHFAIEITPIFTEKNFLGSIILFKDISEHKRNIEIIKRNQEILMEKERLASLGQMIGGIAHNLKTPIMSISGGIEGLRDLIEEYQDSIGDSSVTQQDHREIARDMLGWIEKIRPHCAYMSDLITTVKGQAAQFNTTEEMTFKLNELIHRIELLMKHELKRYHCELNIQYLSGSLIELKGEVNSLVQIFDNLIINALQSYNGRKGKVDLIIEEKGDQILFELKDYGSGIAPSIRDKLFREMVTTKGKLGTGLGLYMSHATIKGKFGGRLWFDSELGKGTSFYIQLPIFRSYPTAAVNNLLGKEVGAYAQT